MEVIELDVRATTAHSFGRKYGAFGHTVAGNFYKRFDHGKWLGNLRTETRRSNERFAHHFRQQYAEYPDLPIWVVTEIMSFGALSRMIEGMERGDIKAIASRYGFQPKQLLSCLHHLVYVRNVCAHHARLWDREWAIKPSLPAGKAWEPPLLPGNDRLFASLLLQRRFMAAPVAERALAKSWRTRIEDLIETRLPNCPKPLDRMGMTPRWKEHPLWI